MNVPRTAKTTCFLVIIALSIANIIGYIKVNKFLKLFEHQGEILQYHYYNLIYIIIVIIISIIVVIDVSFKYRKNYNEIDEMK